MFLKSKWGKVFCIKKGNKSQSKFPIVGLHGGPGGTHLTVQGLLDFSSERQVIIYDQIGSGKSSRLSKKNQSVQNLVQNLDEVIIGLGIDQFHLFGTSWGGTLALEYYHFKKGKQIASLILSSPLISEKAWSNDAKKLINKMSKKEKEIISFNEKYNISDSKLYQEVMNSYYDKYVFRFLKNKDKILPNLFKGSNIDMYKYLWGNSEFSSSGLLKNYDGTQLLKKVKCPILLMCGKYDEATPESNKKFSKLNKNINFKIIPKSSHLSLFENKKAVLKSISSFLRKIETKNFA